MVLAFNEFPVHHDDAVLCGDGTRVLVVVRSEGCLADDVWDIASWPSRITIDVVAHQKNEEGEEKAFSYMINDCIDRVQSGNYRAIFMDSHILHCHPWLAEDVFGQVLRLFLKQGGTIVILNDFFDDADIDDEDAGLMGTLRDFFATQWEGIATYEKWDEHPKVHYTQTDAGKKMFTLASKKSLGALPKAAGNFAHRALSIKSAPKEEIMWSHPEEGASVLLQQNDAGGKLIYFGDVEDHQWTRSIIYHALGIAQYQNPQLVVGSKKKKKNQNVTDEDSLDDILAEMNFLDKENDDENAAGSKSKSASKKGPEVSASSKKKMKNVVDDADDDAVLAEVSAASSAAKSTPEDWKLKTNFKINCKV